jgi:hypothetical protein
VEWDLVWLWLAEGPVWVRLMFQDEMVRPIGGVASGLVLFSCRADMLRPPARRLRATQPLLCLFALAWEQ